jgi:pyruvate dehydrogenase E2 component (dihydrolipoamide acetyltransferase)
MIDVKLPDIGEGIAEGEIVKWSVKVGDTITIDQPLLEILTDKASVEIPAPATGTVSSLLFEAGDLVPVGSVIARIQDQSATTKPATATASATQTAMSSSDISQRAEQPNLASAANTHNNALATPSVRRFALEANVNLGEIQGSGPYGRISREDIEQHKSLAVITPSQNNTTTTTTNETRIPLRGIRRKIADQMVKAKFTAPDFFYGDEADFTELVTFRKTMAEQLKSEGIKLTYLPFIIKAVISGLKAYPTLNASLDDDAQEVVMKHDYNIGFATDSPNGLFVPVIHHADRLSIIELSQSIQRLAEQVREGKANASDMRGGTFTLTNIGAIGGMMCAPIINHPEVGIMGINKIYQKPMVYQGEIAIRWACNISLSFDHRVVDGADGARFCNHVIQRLQNPQRLLLET